MEKWYDMGNTRCGESWTFSAYLSEFKKTFKLFANFCHQSVHKAWRATWNRLHAKTEHILKLNTYNQHSHLIVSCKWILNSKKSSKYLFLRTQDVSLIGLSSFLYSDMSTSKFPVYREYWIYAPRICLCEPHCFSILMHLFHQKDFTTPFTTASAVWRWLILGILLGHRSTS